MAFGIDDLAAAGLSIINKFIPDPAVKAQAQQQWLEMEHKERMAVLGSSGEIIKTEAASSHWLAANWRPLTMITFTALIVARWFGWAAPNLSPEEYIKLWNIVEFGLGGYVIGRSVEKIAPSIAGALKK
jgi:hypothetical protein